MISPVKIQENTNGSLQDLVTVSDIVDYGSNANGSYIRFANGILLMHGIFVRENASIPISVPRQNHYASNLLTTSLPYSYPIFTGSIALGQDPGWGNSNDYWFYGGYATNIGVRVILFSSTNLTIGQIHLQWVFIGRWK